MKKHSKRGVAAFLIATILCLQFLSVPATAETKKVKPKVTLSANTYTYDGKTKTPAVTVKYKGKTLNPSEYSIKYGNGRTKVGSYKVRVRLKGKYSGEKTKKFKIIPKGTYITSAEIPEGKTELTIRWEKQTTEVSGYKIQYSTDKNFKNNTTTVRVKTAEKEETVLKKGVKAGKSYYLRIKTYKKVNGKKYYSGWNEYGKCVTVNRSKSNTRPGSSNTGHGFSPKTEMIVKAHMNDFNYNTFDRFMSAHGGAENYVRSLGGVFRKWCGVQGNVKSAGQFQEIAEYVMGIMTIWGPDYHGGGGLHKFNANYGKGNEYGRFYS
jgi:hypothetical protein